MPATLDPIIAPLDPAAASGKTKDLLDAVQKKLGLVPNMMRSMAHAPAVLEAYLAFAGALDRSSLSPKLREQIALAVGQANSCDYCVAAHTVIGGVVGLAPADARSARTATSNDPRTDAILKFARDVVQQRGQIKPDQLDRLQQAGVTPAQIMEIVAVASLNVFTNYFNHIVHTELDFPQPA